jgi:hypothetical protein
MSEARPHERLSAALCSLEVRSVADRLREAPQPSLARVLELGAVLARACGDRATAERLTAEVGGYDAVDEDALPEVRRVGAFASPFPVRALDLGLLDAEEVFLVNREKFSQVTLAIAQPVEELESALEELGEAGVLSLRVPAARVNGRSAQTPPDDEVYIYVLPREIRRILDSARQAALDALVGRLVEAAAPSD